MSKQIHIDQGNIYYEEFRSLSEFYGFVFDPQFDNLKSYFLCDGQKNFYGTETMSEAKNLAINGWNAGSIKLTSNFKKITLNERKLLRKQFIDMCGFQAIVPLYLNGAPMNMMNQKLVQMKNKIVTINKMVGYTAEFTPEKMLRENTKTLALIDEIEKAGYRVNLNVIYCSEIGSHHRIIKIKAKSAGEKLNISKLAFPLCHPSMHRRVYFRYLVAKGEYSAGGSQFGKELFEMCKKSGQFKGEYIIPQILAGNIKTVEDLDAHFKVM